MRYAVLLLLLSGCGSTPIFTPVEVDIPVACPNANVSKPDFAMKHVQKTDTVADKTKAALIELNQRQAYETLLEAQIAACR